MVNIFLVMEKNNPKALNLEAVRKSKSAVTIGFKCSPQLKLLLAKEAEQVGLTLSNYVNKLLDLEINEKIFFRKKNEDLEAILRKKEDELNFFKDEILFELLEKHKGLVTEFYNRDGVLVNLKVNTIKDVYILIINSFKYQK